MREERMLGHFVGSELTSDALFEIERREIKRLTDGEIEDKEITGKEV